MSETYQAVLLASIKALQEQRRISAVHDAAWAAHAAGMPCRAVITAEGYGIAFSGQWFDGETIEVLNP